MEEIAKVLKTIIEKHLIPAIASVAITLAVVLLLPADNAAIERLGEDWFKLLVFSVSFISIKTIEVMYKKLVEIVKTNKTKKKNKVEKEEQVKKEQEENLKKWQDAFDQVTPYEADLIRELVKNENRPVKREFVMGTGIHSGVFGGMGYGPRINENYKDQAFICTSGFEKDEEGNTRAISKYKLTEPVYEAAKYIMETKGRLTTFEEVE